MSESNLYDRVYNKIVDRRERILSGKLNCIPWKFPRLEEELPGIEQGKYYLMTANSKVGRRFAPKRCKSFGKFLVNSQ
jgi:hypothetical protein